VHAAERCSSRAPKTRTPEGMPVERCAAHPTFRYRLEPTARCELELEHDGPHRNGGLIWHEPPLLLLDGAEVPPMTTADLERLDAIGSNVAALIEARDG
jgi:hypothetical protein